MKKIYICCEYSGLEENHIKAQGYCRYVKSKGNIPICPVTMLHGVYDDRIPEERKQIKAIGQQLLKLCDEVWVFGSKETEKVKNITSGGKPIIYVKDSFSFNDMSQRLTVLMNNYQTKTGRLINRWIMENIVFYIESGLSDELIKVAIEKAASKSLGWEYAEGILKKCLENGITTAEEMKQKEKPLDTENDFAAYDLNWYEKWVREKD